MQPRDRRRVRGLRHGDVRVAEPRHDGRLALAGRVERHAKRRHEVHVLLATSVDGALEEPKHGDALLGKAEAPGGSGAHLRFAGGQTRRER